MRGGFCESLMKLAKFGIAALFALDQGTKIWVRRTVPVGHVSELVPNLFDLTHAPNKGVAFSTFANLPASVRVPMLLVIPLAVTLVMLFYFVRLGAKAPPLVQAGLVLVLGGALGNLADRAIYGEVTDFVRFRWFEHTFFVNNLADDFISIGGVLLFISAFVQRRQNLALRAVPQSPA